jgi:hypothetical protein
MADVKRLVEDRHGAIDVLKTWSEVARFVGNMRRSPAFR